MYNNRLFISVCNLVYKVSAEAIAMTQQKYIKIYEELSMQFVKAVVENMFNINNDNPNNINYNSNNINHNNINHHNSINTNISIFSNL